MVEIVLGLLITAVLIAAILPLGGPIIQKVQAVKIQQDLTTVAQACKQYYASLGYWPTQISDLQPYFLSQGFDGRCYVLNSQPNILTIILGSYSITVVKPRGLMGT
ncbi:MAG: hypothetical protein HQL15_08375 [Candidatus Omnitrophica bacterium]|nr:hypothetical protein [Candidatus Omnitrophota bacterium]